MTWSKQSPQSWSKHTLQSSKTVRCGLNKLEAQGNLVGGIPTPLKKDDDIHNIWKKMFQTTNQQQCLLISSFDHPNFGLFQFWPSPFFNIPISSVSPPLLTSLTYVHCRFLAETSPCLLQCYSCCYYCCSYSCDLTCKLSPSKKWANDILQRCSRTILNIELNVCN